MNLKLVVVPNDPIADYERAGYDRLDSYFNPTGLFDEVIVLSPLEQRERRAFGMEIRAVAARDFTRAVREIRPHVVRAYGGGRPALLACRQRLHDIPVVVSVHTSRPQTISNCLRYADLVICLSAVVRDRVLDVGVDPQRIRMLPNRVDTTVFRPIADRRALEAVAKQFPPGKHILHVGRRVHDKNLDTLIRALPLLPPAYSCVFVGMGDKSGYEALANELGVASRCFWIDAVPNSELPAWYSWCDCFCVPSRFEGFGFVFIEAAACGAPIVTSDIRPMNEYLAHDVSAWLVADYTDPRALADGIRKVCEDAGYRQRISAGAVKVGQSFDKRAIDAAEAAIYREAVALPPLSLSRRFEIAHWKMKTALRPLRSSVEGLGRALLRRPTASRAA